MHQFEQQDFEAFLNKLCNKLTIECREYPSKYSTSKEFENRVRDLTQDLGKPLGFKVNFDPHPYVFPDIVLGEYGIEVKHTTNDTWRSVANSVFESTRDHGVKYIYLLFGKMGGTPEVKWGKYDECVIHVRTSHVPRFEVEINPKKSLFEIMNTSYEKFIQLTFAERMQYIRRYARGRLKQGEHLWWLDDEPENSHSLPLEVRLYMKLEQEEKRRLRAEAAILCPQIVKPSRAKNKYDDAAMYLLTYHGVLCPQARDLFSAGSVALRSDPERGGIYILRALQDIENEMRNAAMYLEDDLFKEYWDESCKKENRIRRWLELADGYAQEWKPSEVLFLNK